MFAKHTVTLSNKYYYYIVVPSTRVPMYDISLLVYRGKNVNITESRIIKKAKYWPTLL